MEAIALSRTAFSPGIVSSAKVKTTKEIIPKVPTKRWTHLVNYDGFLTIDEFTKLDQDVQEQYLMFIYYLGITTPEKLAAYFKTSLIMANRIIKKNYFREYDDAVEEIAAAGKSIEESALGNYRGPILVSLRRATRLAQSLPTGDQRLLDAIHKLIQGYVSNFSKKCDQKGTYDFVTSTNPKATLSLVDIEIIKEEKEMKAKKKVKEFYGLEKVVGKVYTDIDENDFEKGITGCPIDPIYDEEKFLNDESYLRGIFTYFPHVPTSLITKYLFNKGCGCTIFAKTQKRISELGIKQQVVNKRDSLYEQATFVGWALKDPYKAVEFVYEYNKKHGEAKPKTLNVKSVKSASAKDENPKKEEEPMTKKEQPTIIKEKFNQTDSVSVKLTGDMAYIFRKLAEIIDDGAKVEILK